MLTTATPSADAACSYYPIEGLKAEGGHTLPVAGKGATLLGLKGVLTPAEQRSLFRNRAPDGGRLTPHDRADRKAATDFCLSPPKCVAIAHQVLGDKRIAGEVAAAATDTARMMERGVRVRVGYRRRVKEHVTGMGVIQAYYHFHTRPVNGVPDPGDHVHVLFANVSWHKGKRYAAELDQVVKNAPLYRDFFHANLRGRMERLGYQTKASGFSFEIEGIPKSVIAKFSNRNASIKATHARAVGTLAQQLADAHTPEEIRRVERQLMRVKAPKARAGFAAAIREKKENGLKGEKLHAEWMKRISPNEFKLMGSVAKRNQGNHPGIDVGGALGKALARLRDAMAAQMVVDQPRDAYHLQNAVTGLLGANSRVSEEMALTEALKQGVGSVSFAGLEQAMEEMPGLIRAEVEGKAMLSTKENLRRETQWEKAAEEGRIVWVKRRIEGLPDAAELGFSEAVEQLSQLPDSQVLVLAGDAAKLPEGHPLKRLRAVGVRPHGETDRKPVKKVLSAARLPKGWGKAVKRHMQRLRAESMHTELETQGHERSQSAGRGR